jgi:hypothetical protein
MVNQKYVSIKSFLSLSSRCRLWRPGIVLRVVQRRLNVLAGIVSIVAPRRIGLPLPDPRDESRGYHQSIAPRCAASRLPQGHFAVQ